MENGDFKVFLQPKFSLMDFSVTGAEALIRWKRPDGTMIYPDDFIPLYEKNGQITELDLYVFEQVAALQKKTMEKFGRYIPISVNLSLRHALEPDTVKRYQQVLDQYGLDSSAIEIELAETGSLTSNDYQHIKNMI